MKLIAVDTTFLALYYNYICIIKMAVTIIGQPFTVLEN